MVDDGVGVEGRLCHSMRFGAWLVGWQEVTFLLHDAL